MSKPPTLFTSMTMGRLMHGTSHSKSQVYMLDCKILKFFRARKNRRKSDAKKCDKFFRPTSRFLWFFAIHVSFIVPLKYTMMWNFFLKLMQICENSLLHCNFDIMKNYSNTNRSCGYQCNHKLSAGYSRARSSQDCQVHWCTYFFVSASYLIQLATSAMMWPDILSIEYHI